MDRRNKHPIDQGELALERQAADALFDEMERLGEIVVPPPILSPKRLDFRHLRLITSVPGNPFLRPPEPPDDEPNAAAA